MKRTQKVCLRAFAITVIKILEELTWRALQSFYYAENGTHTNLPDLVWKQISSLERRISEYTPKYRKLKSLENLVDERDSPMSTIFSSPALVKHICQFLPCSPSKGPIDQHCLSSLYQRVCKCSLFIPQINRFLTQSTLTRTVIGIPADNDNNDLVQFTFYVISDTLRWMRQNRFKIFQAMWVSDMFGEGFADICEACLVRVSSPGTQSRRHPSFDGIHADQQ
ncbi:hypothetical protein BLNAU_2120 [Blattamonas nauphoetae]|uniref:Uncharacterized protein n=1 Tax=Blattamonas nauphoetae TaxID=2049346 RepID=A0ABQ9YH60_9EUKA|nr:hypothetical protein BLNAU_2120 [Blattamonas nauphoetae]